MSGAEIAAITDRLDRVEARLSELEAIGVDMPRAIQRAIATELATVLPGMLESIIAKERILSDAQRFRDLVSLGRKVAWAVSLSAATGVVGIVLTTWLR